LRAKGDRERDREEKEEVYGTSRMRSDILDYGIWYSDLDPDTQEQGTHTPYEHLSRY